MCLSSPAVGISQNVWKVHRTRCRPRMVATVRIPQPPLSVQYISNPKHWALTQYLAKHQGNSTMNRGGRYIDEKLSKADKLVFLKLSATYRYRKMEVLKLSKNYRYRKMHQILADK